MPSEVVLVDEIPDIIVTITQYASLFTKGQQFIVIHMNQKKVFYEIIFTEQGDDHKGSPVGFALAHINMISADYRSFCSHQTRRMIGARRHVGGNAAFGTDDNG